MHSSSPRSGRSGPRSSLAVLLAAGALMLAVPAYAAGSDAAPSSSIDHVQPSGADVQLVLSLQGVPEGASPDLDTVAVTFDGTAVDASAEPLADSGATVRRTTVLAMDVSDSMNGAKFDAAKAAAKAFLQEVPADVSVGLVTFAGKVTVPQEPTRDVAALDKVIDSLKLSRGTNLYDGIVKAVKTSGKSGSRSILVLSDGRDTSKTPLATATKAVKTSGVKLDVVALAQSAADRALIERLAGSGHGSVIAADDPSALTQVFADEAQTLARQVLVTATPPAELAGKEGTMTVALDLDGNQLSDDAFVTIPSDPAAKGSANPDVKPAYSTVDAGLQIPRSFMLGGLAAAGVAVAVILAIAIGGRTGERQDAVDRSIEAYTRKGARRLATANLDKESQSVTQQAVAVADRLLEGQKGLEATLGTRLEAAGMALKPAEWLLLHFGVAMTFGTAALLLSGGNLLYMLVALALGLAGPWVFLVIKRTRRLKAFNGQLADTLQLMAGALSAGLSLPQSVDTVVREGTDPMAAEFRRALVETRLGVDIEEALKGIAERMQSVDFEWVVMAIRIQREVGGNLAELLNKVAETIREREYLERQVKTLSAEGRLSVWILGGLPPVFMGYLALTNRAYLSPMFQNPIGIAMLVVMGVLLTGGIFWMKKVVKVEV